MIIGIDATNIRIGGGVQHLVEILKVASPEKNGFSQIVVFGSKNILAKVESRTWLIKVSPKALDGNLIQRVVWQCFFLSNALRKYQCNLLFVPGGSYAGNFRPVVSMIQNLIPFEWKEIRRYGWSLTTLKLILLRFSQGKTFTSADGLIFLTDFSRSVVSRVIQITDVRSIIIPHGINNKFSFPAKLQLPIENYSYDHPYRLLYISTVDMFKHQWHVVEAVAKLRSLGYPIVLDLVGSAYPQALVHLTRAIYKYDPRHEFIKYHGSIPYDNIEQKYSEADLFVFASSCETFGQIITEAMCAGLPIACSESSSMSEILECNGVYFNPLDPSSIAEAIRCLLDDPNLRTSTATAAKHMSTSFTWDRCADQTFAFFKETLSLK